MLKTSYTDRNTILATVKSAIIEVARNKGEDILIESEEQKLVENLGLDSLDLAVLVVTLESAFGIDPFMQNMAVITEMQTVGNLCDIYQRCLIGGGSEIENEAVAVSRRKQVVRRRPGKTDE